MHYLVTGGCGFVGSSLAVRLLQEGYQVTCLDNLSRRGSELLLSRILDAGARFVHGDIRCAEDLEKLTSDFDALIECSAESSVMVGANGQDARYMIETNLSGSINCFEFARVRKLPILYMSSSRIYPYDRINACQFKETETRFSYADNKPGISVKGVSLDFNLSGRRSLYGATKLSSEYILQEYSQNYKIPSIINRCGVIAGSYQLGKADQGIFTFWLCNHYFKKNLKYIGFNGQGKQVRDLISVDDLTNLMLKQLKNIDSYFGQVFNVGGSDFCNLSLLETTQLVQKITGNKVEIAAELQNRPADVIWYLTDNGNTEKEFDWKLEKNPETILTDIFNWIRQHENLFKKIVG